MAPRRYDLAVSPVIGVMLMLVATLIIAGVVSTFSSGLVTDEKTPLQVTVRATYHQGGNLTIEHMGGSPIPIRACLVTVRPSRTFGDLGHLVTVIDKNPINDGKGSHLAVTVSIQARRCRLCQQRFAAGRDFS